jgi:GMP synthase-like glutamine amidotransferase
MTRLRALILQHEDPTPPGYVTEWLASHDAEGEVYRIDLEERPFEPGAQDLIVSLGSEFAAFDDSKPFVRRELALMERAVEADVPILGLCFGGQMLARVLGATGHRGEISEIGWLPVRTNDAELVPEGPWFQWHFDTFPVPENATLIAESDAGPQAFVAGRSLGLQFHPEVTTGIMDEWVRVYRHELDGDGVDADALLEETYRIADASRANCMRLFDAFLSDIAKLTVPARADDDDDEALG